MVSEQKFTHRTLRLFDLRAFGRYDHSVRYLDRARGLKLRHLFDAHQTHAARSLRFEILVIAKRRDALGVFAAHVDQNRTFLCFDLFTIDRDLY